MKMPSTYISLLLLCGFMYVFYFTHQHSKLSNSAPAHPVVKEIKPVVKSFWPSQQPAVPLDKNNEEHEKDSRQAGFSFFTDVICHIVPVLKNVK